MTDIVFDRRQTNMAKGVALLLLLWHHLFYNSPEKYDMFFSVFSFRGIPVESFIADFCKVCVAVFLILSGYGLTKSFSKYTERNYVNGRLTISQNVKYVKNHLLKLLLDYWFIYIIFVPLGLFFGKSFLSVYGKNPLHYLADFFGVSYLFFGHQFTMNKTWWFMSIIIFYYLLFPIFYKLLKYSSELFLLISLFVLFFPVPDFRELKIWLAPFAFGMWISKRQIFTLLSRKINTLPKAIGCSFIFVLLTSFLRINYFWNSVHIDFLFAFSIILFSFLLFSRIPVLNTVLEHLGKYSGAIFMFHTFIYAYYFKYLIYWFKYSLAIFIVMVVVCYLIAVAIEWIKKFIRYDKLVNKLTN